MGIRNAFLLTLAMCLAIMVEISCKTSSVSEATLTPDRVKETTLSSDSAANYNEYTAPFICPMHCDGSGAGQLEECPVCGMQYIKNPPDSLIKYLDKP